MGGILARVKKEIKARGGARGYVAILFAVLMLILASFVGMAVDVGQAYDRKTHYRIVADAASIAGAKTLNKGSTPETIWAEVQRMISLNGLPPSDFTFDCGVWSGSTYVSKTDPGTGTKQCDVNLGANAVRVDAATIVRTMYARIAGTTSFSPAVLSVSSAPSWNCVQPFGIEKSYFDELPNPTPQRGDPIVITQETGNWAKILINNPKDWQEAMLKKVCRQNLTSGNEVDNISGEAQVRQTFDQLFDDLGTTGTMIFPVVTDFPYGRSQGGVVRLQEFIEVKFAVEPTGSGSNFLVTFQVWNYPVSAPQEIQLGDAILVQ